MAGSMTVKLLGCMLLPMLVGHATSMSAAVDICNLAKLSGLKQRVKMKYFNGQKLSSYRNTPLTKLLQIQDHFIQQISCSGWYATMVASHCCFLLFMRAHSSTVHSTGYSGGSMPSAASWALHLWIWLGWTYHLHEVAHTLWAMQYASFTISFFCHNM